MIDQSATEHEHMAEGTGEKAAISASRPKGFDSGTAAADIGYGSVDAGGNIRWIITGPIREIAGNARILTCNESRIREVLPEKITFASDDASAASEGAYLPVAVAVAGLCTGSW